MIATFRRLTDQNLYATRAVFVKQHSWNTTSLLLCYVDHHDKTYRWAERRKLEPHPKTGAAQLVEIRETVQEIIVPTYVTAAQPGDLGQRIFQPPFSWKALGVDIRGHSRTLHVHYRTSRQIRMRADRLLGPKLSDVDGYTEQSVGTISVCNGSIPTIQVFESPEDESQKVGTWLSDHGNEGVMPHERGVFVRSPAELDRARAAVEHAGLLSTVLDEHVETSRGHVSISTMHLANGLKFRAVAVMACNDEALPLQAPIQMAADDADLAEVYNTEHHLLYIAYTRARDHLLVRSVDPASEFRDDLWM